MLTLFNNDIDLTELIYDAHKVAEAAGADMPEDDLRRMAGMALELAKAEDMILDVLEALKESLRKAAKPLLPEGNEGDNVVRIQGTSEFGETLGHVAVTFPESRVKIRKGTDTERLHRVLGDHFADYFEREVQYKPTEDFKARSTKALKDADEHPERAAEARVAMAAVAVKEATPRVSFKPSPKYRAP